MRLKKILSFLPLWTMTMKWFFESQAVNECLQLTKEMKLTHESSKESGLEPKTPLPPLKNLHRASLSSENVSGLVIVSDTEPVTSLVPTKVKNNDQASKIDELTKLVQMLMDEKINSTQKIQVPNFVSLQPESSKILYYMKCKKEDHMTSKHEIYIASLKSSQNYKAKPYQYESPSKQILKSKVRRGAFAESSQSSESSIGVSCTTCGSSAHSTTDHNDFKHFKRGKFDAKADDGYFLGYSFNSKALRVFNTRKQQTEETYQEHDPSRQYQSNYDISYYIIPHGRSLTELIQQNQIPKVIAPNKQGNLHTKDVEVLEAHKSQDTNLASTSSYPIAQDRWSRDQHIELVNIIGDPGEGMLTRSMAAKLTTASAS
ncbi:hypothetical protein Tco_1103443 [Tanacetum coccineum]